jgi:cold shock CspA family protein
MSSNCSAKLKEKQNADDGQNLRAANDDEDGIKSPTRATVTKVVSSKGFAFATTGHGDVFIPPEVHVHLGKPMKGTEVNIHVKRGNRGLIALKPRPRTKVPWKEWQIGQNQISVPDTRPGSEHTVSFACFECGSIIITGPEIYNIKQSAIWTRDVGVVNRTLKLGEHFFNKFKKTMSQAALCTNCNKSIGAIYLKPYHLADEKPFPCLKLNLTSGYDGSVYNDLVLSAESRESAELAISKLASIFPDTCSSEASPLGSAESSIRLIRTTRHTFELKELLNDHKKKYEAAERRAQAAAAEVQTHASKAIEEKRLRENAEARVNALAMEFASGLTTDEFRQWSFEEALGRFQAFEEPLNSRINAAYDPDDPSKSAPVSWSDRGYHYEINWEKLVQVNVDTGTMRTIEHSSATPFKPTMWFSKPWSKSPQQLSGGCTFHSIQASDLDQSETRELAEFNFAFAQLQKLFVGRDTAYVKRVDVYESPVVERNYEMKKSSLKQSRELWVFHGTPKVEAITAIMSGGFKVGGRDHGVPIAHGDVYGTGIYTATGPETPIGYAQNGNARNCVILAKALEGVKGRQSVGDCWAPKDDWLVFKTGEQLIPKYVVHFEII